MNPIERVVSGSSSGLRFLNEYRAKLAELGPVLTREWLLSVSRESEEYEDDPTYTCPNCHDRGYVNLRDKVSHNQTYSRVVPCDCETGARARSDWHAYVTARKEGVRSARGKRRGFTRLSGDE